MIPIVRYFRFASAAAVLVAAAGVALASPATVPPLPPTLPPGHAHLTA